MEMYLIKKDKNTLFTATVLTKYSNVVLNYKQDGNSFLKMV